MRVRWAPEISFGFGRWRKIKKQTANKANKTQARANQIGPNEGSRQIKSNQIGPPEGEKKDKSNQQVRRPVFPVFELFNAAWCVRTPQPRGTQPRLRCSVVGLLRAPPAPRLRFCRGSASCAFPALSPTRFGLLVATKPHTSGGLAALRVPVGEGIAGAKTPVQ